MKTIAMLLLISLSGCNCLKTIKNGYSEESRVIDLQGGFVITNEKQCFNFFEYSGYTIPSGLIATVQTWNDLYNVGDSISLKRINQYLNYK